MVAAATAAASSNSSMIVVVAVIRRSSAHCAARCTESLFRLVFYRDFLFPSSRERRERKGEGRKEGGRVRARKGGGGG